MPTVDPRAHHQGLRPRRGRRGQEHHPPAEEAQRRRSCGRSAPASASRSRTTTSPMRRSTARPTTAPRSSTCASAGRRSAAPCPSAATRRAHPHRTSADTFEEFHTGTDGRKASTTMVFVRMLSKLLRDEQIGKLIVPIVPDEARTFGMEALFRQVGIYAHVRPALRAGRPRHAALLQGSQRRADPRGRHQRGRLDVVVHRRRHRLRDATASTRFRSSSSTRCSASSASAT